LRGRRRLRGTGRCVVNKGSNRWHDQTVFSLPQNRCSVRARAHPASSGAFRSQLSFRTEIRSFRFRPNCDFDESANLGGPWGACSLLLVGGRSRSSLTHIHHATWVPMYQKQSLRRQEKEQPPQSPRSCSRPPQSCPVGAEVLSIISVIGLVPHQEVRDSSPGRVRATKNELLK
jgi:hypothetical protein